MWNVPERLVAKVVLEERHLRLMYVLVEKNRRFFKKNVEITIIQVSWKFSNKLLCFNVKIMVYIILCKS